MADTIMLPTVRIWRTGIGIGAGGGVSDAASTALSSDLGMRLTSAEDIEPALSGGVVDRNGRPFRLLLTQTVRGSLKFRDCVTKSLTRDRVFGCEARIPQSFQAV